MSVLLDCKACDFKRKVQSKYAGKKVKCPECGTVNFIPITQNSPNVLKEFKINKSESTQPRTVGDVKPLELADNFARAIAYIYDSLIYIGIPTQLVLFVLLQLKIIDLSMMATLYYFFGFIAFSIYFSYFLLKHQGQTPGAKKMGIKIVSEDGSELETNNAVTRSVLGAAPQIFAPLNLIHLMVFFREDRKSYHDLAAGTKVVEVTARSKDEKIKSFVIAIVIALVTYFVLTAGSNQEIANKGIQAKNQALEMTLQAYKKSMPNSIDQIIKKFEVLCQTTDEKANCDKFREYTEAKKAMLACIDKKDAKACYKSHAVQKKIIDYEGSTPFLEYACVLEKKITCSEI